MIRMVNKAIVGEQREDCWLRNRVSLSYRLGFPLPFVAFLFLSHRPLTQTTGQLIGDDCQRLAEIFQITRNYCSFVAVPEDDHFFNSESKLGSDEGAGGDGSE